MSNFILINSDTKINLDLVRSFRFHKSSKSVYIIFSNGDEEKYFVPESFEFDDVNNIPHVNTIPAELNRYILVCNVDLNNSEHSAGWMENHQIIGWERIDKRTMPISTQYVQKNFVNKSEYIIDLKEKNVCNTFDNEGIGKIQISGLDAAVDKGDISEDHAEYIKNIATELEPSSTPLECSRYLRGKGVRAILLNPFVSF